MKWGNAEFLEKIGSIFTEWNANSKRCSGKPIFLQKKLSLRLFHIHKVLAGFFWTKKLSSKFIRFQKEFTNFHFPCDQHLWDLNPTFGIEIEMCCHINIYFMGKWWDNDLSDFCDKRTLWVKIISERAKKNIRKILKE